MSSDNRILITLTMLLSLFIFGCSGDSDSIEASVLEDLAAGNCSVSNKNEFVYQEMLDTYLWYDQVPVIDSRKYDSPEAVLEATRYQALDRFSFIMTIEEFNATFFTGEFVGIGFDLNNEGYILSVYDDSPADINGVQRGDRILFVNDISLATIIADNLWGTIFGEQTAGTQVTITFEKVDTNDIVALNFTKEAVVRNTVLHRSVINHNNQKVGYLVFNGFTNLSYEELAEAFAYFDTENIDELILDLRYNRGGFLDVATLLASLIVGPALEDQLFSQLTHNDKHSNQNEDVNFRDEPNALGLNQLTVLTTGSSCSASEAVINGLEPYIDVNVVGETSCGKPVGMTNPQHCDFRLSHIEFKVTNVAGYGDYFDGIQPDCLILDTAEHDYGDTNEALLGEALYLMEHGNCSPKSKSTKEPIRDPSFQPWNYTLNPNQR